MTTLQEALVRFVYETTHLSPLNDDGSHDCRISAQCLENGRSALRKWQAGGHMTVASARKDQAILMLDGVTVGGANYKVAIQIRDLWNAALPIDTALSQGDEQPDTDGLAVTQADREAAATYWDTNNREGTGFAAMVREGHADEYNIVQAFARHRKAVLEEAAKVVARMRTPIADPEVNQVLEEAEADLRALAEEPTQ